MFRYSYVIIVIVERILSLCVLFYVVNGHGRLMDPPARGTLWRLGFDTPPNYNDHALSCGGYARQWIKNKGGCGVCGDQWDLDHPRPNESGGIFGTGTISRVYREGEEIVVTVHLTSNHLGWFEFRLCENDVFQKSVTQSCLNEHVLSLGDFPGTRYEVKQEDTGLFRIKLELPDGVTCSNCVFQWHYTSGNNWGYCQDGKNKPGCGPQEVFRGCSDIAIFSLNDTDYFKYENLTRKIDYDKFIFLNDKSGKYNSGTKEEDENYSGESEEEKILNVETLHGKNSRNKDRNRIKSTGFKKQYKEINRNRKRQNKNKISDDDNDNNSSDEYDNDDDNNDNNDSNDDYYEEKSQGRDKDTDLHNPDLNYFSDEIHSGNYVFSKNKDSNRIKSTGFKKRYKEINRNRKRQNKNKMSDDDNDDNGSDEYDNDDDNNDNNDSNDDFYNDKKSQGRDKDTDLHNPDPNYFSNEINSGNYVFSKIYQKNHNGSLTELRPEKPSQPTKLNLEIVTKLNQDAEDSDHTDKLSFLAFLTHSHPKDLRNLDEKSKISLPRTNENRTTKLSKVLTLILSFITSSSNSEADQFLDTLGNVLAVSLLRKSKEDDERKKLHLEEE